MTGGSGTGASTSTTVRPGTPLSLEDARRLIQQYVDRYNYVRLHSAIGYVTPNDMLVGRQAEIHAERDRKLEEARHVDRVREVRGRLLRRSMSAGQYFPEM